MSGVTWRTDHLNVEYSQYYLCEWGSLPDPEEIPRISRGNTLAGAGSGYLTIMPGTHSGCITLAIECRDNEPPQDFEAWESVVDLSHHSEKGIMFPLLWAGDTLREAGNLAHKGPAGTASEFTPVGVTKGDSSVRCLNSLAIPLKTT